MAKRKYDPQRIEEVLLAIATRTPRGHIVRSLAQKWGVRVRAAERAVAEAERILLARAQHTEAIEEYREKLVESGDLIFRKQLNAGHWNGASRTLDMLARWRGIGTPQGTSVNIVNASGVLTSHEAIKEQLRLLELETEERARKLSHAREVAKALTPQIEARLLEMEDQTAVTDGGDDGDSEQ
ncbi:MAG TPA: hypothetical protein VGM90_14910 [Kofleriaceae bacterium]|jgi:hypothetical protein